VTSGQPPSVLLVKTFHTTHNMLAIQHRILCLYQLQICHLTKTRSLLSFSAQQRGQQGLRFFPTWCQLNRGRLITKRLIHSTDPDIDHLDA